MKLLWLLWLFVLLPAVLGQTGFGRSYLKNSRLCHQWNCINTKLGLPESLPPQQQSETVLRNLLPAGPWQDVVGKVLDNCYNNRTRRFTNTCPGQALMHCVVDQLIDNCPESSWRQDDACSPLSSIAGLKNMFTQSRYDKLEKNLPREHRPEWFLKNYFDTKCCDVPVLFNNTVLEECGFSSFITYYTHGPKYDDEQTIHFQSYKSTAAPATSSQPSPSNDGGMLHIVDFSQTDVYNDITDPLDCCDMTQFIQSTWRTECDFHLSWGGKDRLVIASQASGSTEAPTTTTTERTNVKDLVLLPHSCEKNTCVFRKLGLLSERGSLDIDAYMKILHNFTDAYPAWGKAKARVFTKCLAKSATGNYDTGCEINNVLSCSFDVLTENCPNSRKSDNCKHGKHDFGCQISSSKYRPKNRRDICPLPALIHHDHLSECGLQSMYRVEHVAVPHKPKRQGWFTSRYTCKDSKAPTTCIMGKMGILNKYKFMDYFKMKDRIRQFTTNQAEWAALLDVYMSAFINIPMYGEHCNSQKKLLNVIDAMLMTCPISKRKNTAQCNKIFDDMTNTSPMDKQNITREKLDEILKHYNHVFLPSLPVTTKLDKVIRKKHLKHSKTVKNPIFEFGFLNSKDAPPVKVISLKPETTPSPPLILRPVYLHPSYGQMPYYGDGVFRSNPFWLHEQIAKAHISTTTPTVHTVPTSYNNVYSARPVIPTTVPSFTQTEVVTDFPIQMLKPE